MPPGFNLSIVPKVTEVNHTKNPDYTGLFGFLMEGHFLAELAELLEFQSFLDCLAIAPCLVVQVMTYRTFHMGQIILRHTMLLND